MPRCRNIRASYFRFRSDLLRMESDSSSRGLSRASTIGFWHLQDGSPPLPLSEKSKTSPSPRRWPVGDITGLPRPDRQRDRRKGLRLHRIKRRWFRYRRRQCPGHKQARPSHPASLASLDCDIGVMVDRRAQRRVFTPGPGARHLFHRIEFSFGFRAAAPLWVSGAASMASGSSMPKCDAARLTMVPNSIAFRKAISSRGSGSCTAKASGCSLSGTLSSRVTSRSERRAFSAFSIRVSRRLFCLISLARLSRVSTSP